MTATVQDHVDISTCRWVRSTASLRRRPVHGCRSCQRPWRLTVAASGNSADKPYISGTPAAAPTALSVAQTQVPSAVLPFMEVTAPEDIAGLYSAVFQDWSVPLSVSGAVEGPLQYGNGVGSNLDGCLLFASGSLSGKVILVDRGACNFTLKISNISVAGGVAGIIGLIDNSDPFNGGDGGDRPIDIPGFMISKALADLLRSGLPGHVRRVRSCKRCPTDRDHGWLVVTRPVKLLPGNQA